MRVRRLCGWIALALAGVLAVPAWSAGPGERYRVVAYWLASPAPARQVPPERIPAARLTHLNVAFATPDAQGALALAPSTLDGHGPVPFAGLRALKKRHPHLRTLISVGGWAGSAHFSDLALTPQSRARFAESGVAFLRRHGFDGIDIDWEFPVAGGMPSNAHRLEDKRNFTLLLAALRERLDAAGREDRRRYLLTAVVGHTEAYLVNTEIVAVARLVDWLNVMAYDMNGTWAKVAAHLAPLRSDPAMQVPGTSPRNNVADLVERYLAAGVPARKLTLGVPFYGYSWKGCPPARHGEYQTCAGPGRGTWEDGALDYTDIAGELVNRNGFRRHWNAAAQAAFLHNPATREFISYEDPQSLRAKLRLVKARRLGGVMIWELGGDRRQELLAIVARELAPRRRSSRLAVGLPRGIGTSPARRGPAARRGRAPQRAALARHTVSPTSSATSSDPRRSMATPTGRP
ncbi:MAG TPA: glycoside hydrolase family 18 protein [Albitalea sp.]